MISYPFIQDLFKNILTYSKGIQGRFYVCPKYGHEINSDNLNEVIKDVVKATDKPKYPLALLMPPVSWGDFTQNTGEWETYKLIMFFLKTTYYDSNNQIQTINVNTQTSMHTVPQDWHDMKRCAVNFVRALNKVTRDRGLIQNKFRIVQKDRNINPVSFIGTDRVAGVRLDFNVEMFLGCEVEDYNEGDIPNITIPVDDSHPEHKL